MPSSTGQINGFHDVPFPPKQKETGKPRTEMTQVDVDAIVKTVIRAMFANLAAVIAAVIGGIWWASTLSSDVNYIKQDIRSAQETRREEIAEIKRRLERLEERTGHDK